MSTAAKLAMGVGILMVLAGVRACGPQQGQTQTGSGWPVRAPTALGGYRLADKQCSACGRSVPLSSKAGQRCPHCGAHWSFEQMRYQ